MKMEGGKVAAMLGCVAGWSTYYSYIGGSWGLEYVVCMRQ
jgi:hypothetical protein